MHNTNKKREIVTEYISIEELAQSLSISLATAKNWLKLDKIRAQQIIDGKEYFTKQYLKSIYKNLSEQGNTLKSRRNKSFIQGNFLYKDYINKNSKNLEKVNSLLLAINNYQINLSEKFIKLIIADTAIKLLSQVKNNPNLTLKNFLHKQEYFGIYEDILNFLVQDRIIGKENLEQFPEIFNINYNYQQNEDLLGLIYISCSNMKNRKSRGAYYTPTTVVQELINETFNNNSWKNKKIFDPCCGTGNFLLQLPENIKLEQIYANDIDLLSSTITKLNLALKYNIQSFDIINRNITTKDYLNNYQNSKYDLIIGNPPWGYKFSEKEKQQLKNKFSIINNSKQIESFDLFIEKAIYNLNINGKLSFVLPEAILNVSSHTPIRNLLKEKTSIQYINYLGNIFNKVHCPSIILQLQYTNKSLNTIGLNIKSKKNNFIINSNRIISNEFNFNCTNEEYKILQKILTIPKAITLKDNAKFALGIVTGNNADLISNIKTSDNEIIIKGTDLTPYKIMAKNNFIKFEPANFQQVVDENIYRTKEKLLYKFISNKFIFAYDNQQRLTLNSCNILIPKLENLNIKYILAILNSSVANFIYQKKFNSIKVLKNHIESIPIPNIDNSTQQEIICYVDKILKTNDKDIFDNLYRILDKNISELYNLSSKEYNFIKS